MIKRLVHWILNKMNPVETLVFVELNGDKIWNEHEMSLCIRDTNHLYLHRCGIELLTFYDSMNGNGSRGTECYSSFFHLTLAVL